jgi:DNA-binding phage protein
MLILRCAAPAGMQTVRLYDADRQQLRATHTQAQAVLDTTFEDDTAAFAAGLEGSVQRCT